MQNTAKLNYSGSVALYVSRPGNEVALFYNAPEPTEHHYGSFCWNSIAYKLDGQLCQTTEYIIYKTNT